VGKAHAAIIEGELTMNAECLQPMRRSRPDDAPIMLRFHSIEHSQLLLERDAKQPVPKCPALQSPSKARPRRLKEHATASLAQHKPPPKQQCCHQQTRSVLSSTIISNAAFLYGMISARNPLRQSRSQAKASTNAMQLAPQPCKCIPPTQAQEESGFNVMLPSAKHSTLVDSPSLLHEVEPAIKTKQHTRLEVESHRKSSRALPLIPFQLVLEQIVHEDSHLLH
jgi:hypothetical protein